MAFAKTAIGGKGSVVALVLALAALCGGALRVLPAAGAEPVVAGGRVDPVAAFRLAVRYENGEGITRDYGRALEVYCSSERAGHVGAAFAIGWIYANGRGVARDDDLAAAWFRKAASLGHEQAAKVLRVIPGRDPARAPTCPRPADEIAAEQSAAFRAAPEAVRTLVRDLAPVYRLDPALVLAVIAVESRFRSDAVSPKNAQGLMQLIPATAARFGVRDAFDPEENLRGGMAYLRWLLDNFAGDVKLAVAAYNAGENAVARHGGVPPYAETVTYVKKIQRLYPSARHPV